MSTMTRLALHFADGSFSVYPGDVQKADALRDADARNDGVTDIRDFADLVWVSIEIAEAVSVRRGIKPKPETATVMALKASLHWHEGELKALSKSGRTDSDCMWRSNQHREQIDVLKMAIEAASEAEGGE